VVPVYVVAVPATVVIAGPAADVRSGTPATERLLLQATDLLCEPDVIVTVAVFVPGDEYVFETELPEPESESVPLQEYVYEPLPPDGDAVQVALPPAIIELGETEQEPVSTGSLTTMFVHAPQLLP
jgi:hypothetical protein